MRTSGVRNRIWIVSLAGVAAAAIWLLAHASASSVSAASATGFYKQTNLVSDRPGLAAMLDPDLVNPWGIALPPTGGAFWVANNGTGTSTLYAGDVNGSPFTKNSLTVSIPAGLPTGAVFNASGDFGVASGAASGPARFIFASQVGVISGWNPSVPPPPPSQAAQVGATADAVYTGLAIAQSGGANYLYAADFEHRNIDVYDKSWHLVHLDGAFDDPNLPNSYAPFDIQALNGKLYVMYAQQSHKNPDEETDRGSGFVDVFDTSGHLEQRLIRGNHLKSPWAIVMAPADFGPFGGMLLVGGFASGHIAAYDPDTGKFMGELNGAGGKPTVIDGLWGMVKGNGTAGDKNAVYFAAGIDDETHGLFGSLRFVSQP
jgi:uncharacterized protein (TIGR03118 family)